MHRSVELQIIRETIEKLIPGATPAWLRVHVVEREEFPQAVRDSGGHSWDGTPQDLAEKLCTALYGRPCEEPVTSPLAQAEDAKRARDIGAEIAALTTAHDRLTSAPWYPVRPGDLVHVHYEAGGEMPAFGETYIVSDAREPGDTAPGLLSMVLLAHTLPDSMPEDDVAGMTGCFESESHDDPLYDLWFEAGPQRVTVVRDGRVVHNGGAR
ncbi:hypothetical protein PV413_23835 [Streptomyces scabiei]|uniref:hypothetical protein n=1 Tax=Streptomyces scabiei TaxID=1930 RepID=UPI0029A47516|nr:hypothetical protein [Streptomyces scabiei]MDX2566056.1 hypothetical protein [Streptomyces scabiei]MDX3150460.1 hypothetical protein [Streptomyces scabiei]MDX3161915.1 hypothetical protein [Streptomyces scabiei]MDX3288096.1 hypothetical protein [Streptomyces scabiei]